MTNEQPDVLFIESFVPDADALFETVVSQTTWDDRMQRRLTANFGAPYNYSNMTYPEVPMPPHLAQLCDMIQQKVGFQPNNCLINRYENGDSTMGFHADSIEELQPQTGVAIVSLGDTRTLQFRRTQDRKVQFGYPLPHGSLFYMPPQVQFEWQHGVLKQANVGPRISLTFRALQ